MAIVTGKLTDCGLQSMAGKAINLVFTLNEPSSAGGAFLVTEPIAAVFTGTNFTVTLQDTETLDQAGRFYSVSATWLDSAGMFVKVDFPDWRLFVPVVGGTLSDLVVNFSPNPYLVYWQATQPDPWPVKSVWVDTSIDTATSGDVLRKDS